MLPVPTQGPAGGNPHKADLGVIADGVFCTGAAENLSLQTDKSKGRRRPE